MVMWLLLLFQVRFAAQTITPELRARPQAPEGEQRKQQQGRAAWQRECKQETSPQDGWKAGDQPSGKM